MTNIEFVEKLKNVLNFKTLYIMGCFGAPMNSANRKRYCNNHEYNKKPERTKMIQAATPDTFGFDCVNTIKGIMWGWTGDKTKTYGGAKYNTNNVPDVSADQMIKLCKNISTDFSNIEVGEAVWCPGHIGVYVGGGLAIECTPKWKNGVQLTACNRSVSGYNRRDWTNHGKFPFIDYKSVETALEPQEAPSICFKVGDIVEFTGDTHYLTANAQTGKKTVPSLAKITRLYESGSHPVHLRAINKNGDYVSGVHGWTDVKDIKEYKKEELKVGDKVQIRKGAYVYNKSFTFQSWVYSSTLYVRSIDGDKVIVSTQTIGAITGTVNIADIIKL